MQGYPESLRVRAWDPDGPPAVSLVADLSDLPPGNDARFILDTDSRVRGKLIWTPTAYDSGGYDVLFTATSGSRSETDTTVMTLEMWVYAQDPDRDPISTWKVQTDPPLEFNGLRPYSFVVASCKTYGTLTWSPYAPDTVAFTFTAANFLSGSTTTRVMVDAPSERARETPGPGGGPPPESRSRLSGLKR